MKNPVFSGGLRTFCSANLKHGFLPQCLHRRRRPKDAAKIQLGNSTMKASASIIRQCSLHGVPAVLENPSGSRICHAPPLLKLASRKNFNEHVLDFCQYGSAHRKRTRFWSWHCGHDNALAQTCREHNGLCTRTHRPHEILEGCIPGTKVLRTAAAEPYPDRFAAKAAALLARALDSLELYNLHRCVI